MSPENTQQDALWYEAQRWLWHQRRHARPGADIWHLRFHWQTEDESLWRRVQEGTYRLTPMQVFRGADGKGLARWSIIGCAGSEMVCPAYRREVAGT